MNTLKYIKYTIFSTCGILGLTTPVAEAATTQPQALDSTMNALDYVLQRPAPSERFAAKRFGDRLFMTIEGGPDWMRTNSGITGASSKTGYRARLTIGDWITPVHGWRVGISAGRHFGVNDTKPYFAGLSVDYLMNLSALLRKDNPGRRFELIGLMGIEGQALHREGHKMWAAGGFRIGLQPRLYLTRSTYMYVEPRIGIYTDGLDDVKTWHKYDWNASVMVGLGYRMNGGTGLHVDNSLFIGEHFRDNLFVSVGGGVQALGNSTNNLRDRISGYGTFSVGKWFSAPAGLRLSLSGSEIREPRSDRRWSAIADIDFMWNLNSALSGYDPDRKIETNVVLGASGAYVSGQGKKFHPGLHAALQGIWNVSQSVGLYLEPQVRVFGRNISSHPSSRVTLMPGVNIGLIYRFRGSDEYNSYKSTFNYEDFLGSRRYFVDLLGGVFMRSRKWHPNGVVSLGFGKWFTPESAWRVSGEYASISESSSYRSLALSTDYMCSLSTLAGGFDDTRGFDLDAFVGLTAGAAHYNRGRNSLVWGPRAGLRGRISVSPAVDIIIEPQAQVLSIPHYRHKYNPEFRVLAGVSYKLGRRSQAMKGESNLITEEKPRNFVNLSGGPMLFSETVFSSNVRKVSWGGEISVGRWLTDASGLQLGLNYDFIHRNRRQDVAIGTVKLDYMLNFTALFNDDDSRRFDIVPMIGIGYGWSDRDNGHHSVALDAGVRASYRVTDRLYVTLTPTVTAWQPKLNGGAGNTHHFIGVGRLPIGVSYRF